MSPVTHFLLGWVVANTSQKLNRKERALITLAGVVPDVDGLGVVADVLTHNTSQPTDWFSEYHHIYGHNIGVALLVAGIGFLLARRRWMTAALVFLSFHLHLFGDLIGSRSPDGYQWAIAYGLPFSHSWQLVWKGQWELNAWQNFVITGIALVITFWMAIKRGYSPLEIFSKKADEAVVETLQRRFQKSE
jgi:inner membrane protein